MFVLGVVRLFGSEEKMTNQWGLLLCGVLLTLSACQQNSVCEVADCDGNLDTYYTCAKSNGDTTFQFGSQSCTCPFNDTTTCNACQASVNAYCGVTTTDGGTPAVCTATFSGAVSGTFTPCAVSITNTSSSSTWVATTKGGAISGTSDTWNGFSFTSAGGAAVGIYNQTAATTTTCSVLGPPTPTPVPDWVASFSSGTSFGSATLTLTSLGTASATNANEYDGAHGNWTGMLVDQAGENAAVALTVAF
jgi:hypothetical protein